MNSKILDIAGYLPNNLLTNEDLAEIYPDWTAEKIFDKTGIKKRYIAATEETAADLACKAAENLFKQKLCSPADIDFVIFITQAPDYILPTSACLLQQRLGISTNAGAIDINLGCSGYVYGLAVAKGLLETGAAKCILLLTADTYSKYIHKMDKSVRTLFGDGATATAILAHHDQDLDSASIGPFVFGTDGSGAKNLIVEAGGFRVPKSNDSSIEKSDDSGNIRTPENLFMNGAAVMSFSLTQVPRAVEDLLTSANIEKSDIDYFVLHQANKFMLDALRKKLKVDSEKLPVLMEDMGNTVSSSIPFALIKMKQNNCLSAQKKILLVGFGVGYSWSACLVNINLGVSNE